MNKIMTQSVFFLLDDNEDIYATGTGSGCNLPLQPVNIPVFVAVLQTSIVVYSMLHQNRESRQGLSTTQYSETPTQARARPLLERERERERVQ